MPSLRRKKPSPGRTAATARAVLRGSPADAGEQERLAALPPWARTRIIELEAAVESLTKRVRGSEEFADRFVDPLLREM
jgi:hypothetical protein